MNGFGFLQKMFTDQRIFHKFSADLRILVPLFTPPPPPPPHFGKRSVIYINIETDSVLVELSVTSTWGRRLILVIQENGPIFLPWGTPAFMATITKLDSFPSNLTCSWRWERMLTKVLRPALHVFAPEAFAGLCLFEYISKTSG